MSAGMTEHYNSVLEIKEAAQFHFWEYINGNQTFILDSHRPFICSAQQGKIIWVPLPNILLGHSNSDGIQKAKASLSNKNMVFAPRRAGKAFRPLISVSLFSVSNTPQHCLHLLSHREGGGRVLNWRQCRCSHPGVSGDDNNCIGLFLPLCLHQTRHAALQILQEHWTYIVLHNVAERTKRGGGVMHVLGRR